MIGLFKAIRDFRQEREASFFSFAKLCINRQLCTAIESSNRKKHLPLNSYISLSEQGDDPVYPLAESPEQMVIEQEIWEEYKRRLTGMLSGMEQQVLDFYLDGDSYTQIAQKMGKTPKSIDNALQRIKQKIKQIHLD
jgi:RNA polymerase sporulation-specific sigma factor